MWMLTGTWLDAAVPLQAQAAQQAPPENMLWPGPICQPGRFHHIMRDSHRRPFFSVETMDIHYDKSLHHKPTSALQTISMHTHLWGTHWLQD